MADESFTRDLEAVVCRCSVKKVFLEISQNLQENTYARVSFLIKLLALGLRPATLLKKRLLRYKAYFRHLLRAVPHAVPFLNFIWHFYIS